MLCEVVQYYSRNCFAIKPNLLDSVTTTHHKLLWSVIDSPDSVPIYRILSPLFNRPNIFAFVDGNSRIRKLATLLLWKIGFCFINNLSSRLHPALDNIIEFLFFKVKDIILASSFS